VTADRTGPAVESPGAGLHAGQPWPANMKTCQARVGYLGLGVERVWESLTEVTRLSALSG